MTGPRLALIADDQRLASAVLAHLEKTLGLILWQCSFEGIRRYPTPDADGLLLLAFHVGDEVLHEDELWGQKISMDFLLFPTSAIKSDLEATGFEIEEIIERPPYPDVEYQSRRAYIFARKR